MSTAVSLLLLAAAADLCWRDASVEAVLLLTATAALTAGASCRCGSPPAQQLQQQLASIVFSLAACVLPCLFSQRLSASLQSDTAVAAFSLFSSRPPLLLLLLLGLLAVAALSAAASAAASRPSALSVLSSVLWTLSSALQPLSAAVLLLFTALLWLFEDSHSPEAVAAPLFCLQGCRCLGLLLLRDGAGRQAGDASCCLSALTLLLLEQMLRRPSVDSLHL